MQLQRTTVCSLFIIKTPVWGGRKIGINPQKLMTHNEIRITYENLNGEKIYPHPFYISMEQAKKYPLERLKKYPDIKLHMIPINELEILERI